MNNPKNRTGYGSSKTHLIFFFPSPSVTCLLIYSPRSFLSFDKKKKLQFHPMIQLNLLWALCTHKTNPKKHGYHTDAEKNALMIFFSFSLFFLDARGRAQGRHICFWVCVVTCWLPWQRINKDSHKGKKGSELCGGALARD